MEKKFNILIVDDEEGYRDLFTYMLEPMGIATTCVSDGFQAVKKIEEKPYDLIFMDVHMPGMTGLETLKKIRGFRPEQKVAIFSSSSDPERSLEKQAEKEGVTECLFKPVEDKDIYRILKKMLGVEFNS